MAFAVLAPHLKISRYVTAGSRMQVLRDGFDSRLEPIAFDAIEDKTAAGFSIRLIFIQLTLLSGIPSSS